ncbi:hypothetical protein Q31b_53820 [Novipirellula aureliae]|uniref:Uncharacterized protein n=1 Tax=Novipirellula aureliae TaxID=2527966 RepID=A0A5C6DK31_9BACT|nr:hypothetical protein Q31b_53820 [Novipirellula aureliae]
MCRPLALGVWELESGGLHHRQGCVGLRPWGYGSLSPVVYTTGKDVSASGLGGYGSLSPVVYTTGKDVSASGLGGTGV